jgi:hypothetical protein
VNVAVTLFGPFIVQVDPLGTKQFVQPPKLELLAGVAIRVTVPGAKRLLHVPLLLVQLIPDGIDVTVPEPEPLSETVLVLP